MKTSAIVASLLLSTFLAGCSSKGSAPSGLTTQSAPAPSNLTPEQKAAYDEAVKKAGPTAGAAAGN